MKMLEKLTTVRDYLNDIKLETMKTTPDTDEILQTVVEAADILNSVILVEKISECRFFKARIVGDDDEEED